MDLSQLFPPNKKNVTGRESPRLQQQQNYDGFRSTPDSVLSAKLSSMSMEERSYGLNEVHGIIDVADESPEMLKEKTDEMNRALVAATATLCVDDSLAYREAIAMSQEYVDRLKIPFLRAVNAYDSEKAAHRMIRFFDYKKKLFGKEKLVREILLDDLCEEAREALRRGLLQLLHQRDRSGRPIFYFHGLVNMMFPEKPCYEVFFYTIMVGMQDEMSQLRGCVCIWNALGVDCFLNRTGSYVKFWSSMPLRHTAFHALMENVGGQYPVVMDVLANKLESKFLCRFRFHYGSPMEGIYHLLTFGIPREAIPLNDDGSLNLSHHHKLLETVRLIEVAKRGEPHAQPQKSVSASGCCLDTEQAPAVLSACSPSCENLDKPIAITDGEEEEEAELAGDIILIPSPMDVLLGRGRQPKSRPGSLRMYHLLHENMAEYEAATQATEKTKIAMKIIKEMKASGCRFLREAEGGGYIEIDDSTARAKIAHGFRNVRRHNKKKGHGAATNGGSTNHQKHDTAEESVAKRAKKRSLSDD